MDAKENGNEPATPRLGCSGSGYGDSFPLPSPTEEWVWAESRGGLTKREHFAAMAMQGMLARSYSVGEQEAPYNAMIAWSVRCADDLLRALAHSAGGEA